MQTQKRWPPTKDGQIKNLIALQDRKQRKIELLKRKAKKLGQLRAFDRMAYLIKEEIQKETKDLQIIEGELTTLSE